MGVYSTTVTTDRTSVGTSFDTAKNHLHNLNAGSPTRVSGQKFVGRLGTLFIHVTSIASSAAKLTVRVSRDSNGDEMIVPDVTATIATGATEATDGSVAIDIDVPYAEPNNTDSMYVLVKTDTGTVTLSESTFSWSDE